MAEKQYLIMLDIDARKINLYLGYEEALTFADDDISENWEIYRTRFPNGGFP